MLLSITAQHTANDAADALAEYLQHWGSWLVFLPTYSPEFNMAELIFNFLNEVAKRP